MYLDLNSASTPRQPPLRHRPRRRRSPASRRQEPARRLPRRGDQEHAVRRQLEGRQDVGGRLHEGPHRSRCRLCEGAGDPHRADEETKLSSITRGAVRRGLISGETGTGKGLVSGHLRGSFTVATQDKPGLFEWRRGPRRCWLTRFLGPPPTERAVRDALDESGASAEH